MCQLKWLPKREEVQKKKRLWLIKCTKKATQAHLLIQCRSFGFRISIRCVLQPCLPLSCISQGSLEYLYIIYKHPY